MRHRKDGAMSGGVSVRLYNAITGERSLLGEIPLESVDRVIPTLKHWGVQEPGGTFADSDTFTGTFQFNDEGASYFEVSFE